MANTVRFIHAADVHLGTQFRQASITDPDLGRALTRATYEAFDRVVRHARDEDVDFIVLAGDTFDSAAMNLPAQTYLATRLTELVSAGIGVFLVHGNHDPASGGSAGMPLPAGVHVFSAEGVEGVDVTAKGGTCRLYGRSYFRSDERSNLALDFQRDPGVVNAIGVLHANVGGSPAHDPYSPCTVADLTVANMDYWALGHIHLEGVVSAANPLAIYPGSTQALTVNETGRHGCYLVELTDGLASARWLPTGSVSVAHVQVDLTTCDSESVIPSLAIESVSENLREATTPTLVRLVLTGRRSFTSPLTDTLLTQLATAVQVGLSERSPRVWVDTTVVNRSRLDRMAEVENSTNPFIQSTLALVDSIDVAELIYTNARLGKPDGRTTNVATANADLLRSIAEDHDDLVREAKEYAISLLLGEGE